MGLQRALLGPVEGDRLCPVTGEPFRVESVVGETFCSRCEQALETRERLLRRDIYSH